MFIVIQVTVIYSHAIIVIVMSEFGVTLSECGVKRLICKAQSGTLANSADPDQMLQNAVSDLGLHYWLKL